MAAALVTIQDATRIQLFLANFDALFYHAVFVVTKLGGFAENSENSTEVVRVGRPFLGL